MPYLYRSAIGQDSHRYCKEGQPLKLAGLTIPCPEKISANSDGDVLFHAVTNAVSGLTGVNILGGIADAMCRQGIVDSRAYLLEALKYLDSLELVHLSVSLEALRPKLAQYIPSIKDALAKALQLPVKSIGITATTGEALTGMGRGEGIQVLCILTAREAVED